MHTMDTERITLQEYHDRIGAMMTHLSRAPYPGEVEAVVAEAVATGEKEVFLDADGNAYVEVKVRR